MKGMRRQQSKSLHLTDMDRARIESDVERFLAAGGEVQEVEAGVSAQKPIKLNKAESNLLRRFTG